MKRWTVLFIPHDTNEPRSVAVSSRALKWMGGAAVVVAIAAIVGVGVLAGLVVRTGGEATPAPVASGGDADGGSAAAEVDSLRATVRALHSALDTIRHADARLSEPAGVPAPDSATLQAHASLKLSRASADSLLRRASLVAGRIGALADSASARDAGRRSARASRAPAPRRHAPSPR